MNQYGENNGNGKDNQPGGLPGNMKGNFWKIIIAVLIFTLLVSWMGTLFFPSDGGTISYTRFKSQVQNGNVRSVLISGDKITATLEQPVSSAQGLTGGQAGKVVTYFPPFGDDELLGMLDEQGVEVNVRPKSDFSIIGLLINILPFVILIWIFYAYYKNMRKQGSSIFGVGQNRAKLYKRSREKTGFDEVAGLEEVKEELKEIIGFLRDPEKFEKIGAKTPKGALLVGPPGSGKTLLARAVAGEADAPFYSITGSDFMEMFVGVGASRVRNLFKDAKKHSPSIIFIDELDSIGRHRGAGLGGGHDEREQTLNQLLSELDGFEPNESTVVFAATNRPDILDPALLRPGRFDRRITVPLPTLKGRVEILEVHARNKPMDPDVDLEKVARGTPGFSGADLENLLNEAALLAARKNHRTVASEDLEGARDKVLMGVERANVVLTDDERKKISYHEGGHAVVAAVLPHADPIHKVTIIPRGQAMGVTQQLPERDKYLYEKDYITDRLSVMLGGRAAENYVFGTTTSGAENDLKEATRLARKMVLDWGMSSKLGHMAFGDDRRHVFLGEEIGQPKRYSEATATEIDEEIKSILNQAYEKAVSALESKKEGLDRLAEELQDKEELTGDQVLKLIGIEPKNSEARKTEAKEAEEGGNR